MFVKDRERWKEHIKASAQQLDDVFQEHYEETKEWDFRCLVCGDYMNWPSSHLPSKSHLYSVWWRLYGDSQDVVDMQGFDKPWVQAFLLGNNKRYVFNHLTGDQGWDDTQKLGTCWTTAWSSLSSLHMDRKSEPRPSFTLAFVHDEFEPSFYQCLDRGATFGGEFGWVLNDPLSWLLALAPGEYTLLLGFSGAVEQSQFNVFANSGSDVDFEPLMVSLDAHRCHEIKTNLCIDCDAPWLIVKLPEAKHKQYWQYLQLWTVESTSSISVSSSTSSSAVPSFIDTCSGTPAKWRSSRGSGIRQLCAHMPALMASHADINTVMAFLQRRLDHEGKPVLSKLGPLTSTLFDVKQVSDVKQFFDVKTILT